MILIITAKIMVVVIIIIIIIIITFHLYTGICKYVSETNQFSRAC